MIAAFDIHDVNKAASAFNPEKLLWLNQQHMVRAAPAALVPYLRVQLQRLGLDSTDRSLLEGVIIVQRERAKTLKEMAQNSRFFFVEQIDLDPKAVAKHLAGAESRKILGTARERLAALTSWDSGSLNVGAQRSRDATRKRAGKNCSAAARGGDGNCGFSADRCNARAARPRAQSGTH